MIRLLPPTFVPLILMLQLLPRAHHRRVAVDAMQLERLLMTTVLLSFWRWVWFCHAKLISLTSDQLSAYCCTVLSPDKGLDIYLYRLVSRSDPSPDAKASNPHIRFRSPFKSTDEDKRLDSQCNAEVCVYN